MEIIGAIFAVWAALEIFSPARVTLFTDTLKKELMLLLREIMHKCNVGGGSTKIDLKSKFVELAFNVLSMTVAGKRYYGENVEDAEEARKARFLKMVMLENSGRSNLGDYLPFLRWIDFKGLEKRFTILMKRLDKFMQDLVDERKQHLSNGSHGKAEKITMIDHILWLQEKEQEYYSDELIKGIIMTYNYKLISMASYGDFWRVLRRLTVVESLSSNSLQKSSVIRQQEIQIIICTLLRISMQHGKSQANIRVDLNYWISVFSLSVIMTMLIGRRGIKEEDIAGEELGKQKIKESKAIFGGSISMNICDFLPVLGWLGYKVLERE
ncbi:hypothetical protein ACH5RR_034938 [Cinchona calisaya]|uniref:Cytochrome P450 n=1 Tax=Cinchona calisaya TaxID=153742 RepID=A0ABD2YGT6_9GENT